VLAVDCSKAKKFMAKTPTPQKFKRRALLSKLSKKNLLWQHTFEAIHE
jgi:hypothetical protein